MNQSELIQSFAKGKASDNTKQSERNAVIYTRVSTKEQADTNQSLETQKKYCLQYALKNYLNVLGFFGGTYESAKTEERIHCEEEEPPLLQMQPDRMQM
jgi:site-specific DNA recombinase